jgi:hypothetical protein
MTPMTYIATVLVIAGMLTMAYEILRSEKDNTKRQ